MVLLRKPMILLADVVGAVIVTALFVAGVQYVLLPGWEARNSLPELRDELNLVHKELTALQARNAETKGLVQKTERSIDENSPRALADSGKLLGLITAACGRSNVELRTIGPAPNDDSAGSSRKAAVTVAGAFTDIYQVVREMETWSAFLRIDDLEIHAPPAGVGVCEARWFVVVNNLAENAASAGAAP